MINVKDIIPKDPESLCVGLMAGISVITFLARSYIYGLIKSLAECCVRL